MSKPRVVIIGAGFGGLAAAKTLKGIECEVVVVDQRNHHVFQPLLYQVATAALAPSEMAWNVRDALRGQNNVQFVLGAVIDIDTDTRQISLKQGMLLSYDYLIVATGAKTSYFGHDDWACYALGLKDLDDARHIRHRLLGLFENAASKRDQGLPVPSIRVHIVGAGPTGVEMAGAVAELAASYQLSNSLSLTLIDGVDQPLQAFAPSLSKYTLDVLKKLGVDFRPNTLVKDVRDGILCYDDQDHPSDLTIWAAGVAASPASSWLALDKAEVARGGRIKVTPHLHLTHHGNVFIVGDLAHVEREDGAPLPGVAPTAKQMGVYAAKAIQKNLANQPLGAAFAYKDPGQLATIGRGAAVVDVPFIRLKGYIAWWFWGIIHIYFLIGIKAKITVALNWLWLYLTRRQGVRLLMEPREKDIC